MISRTLLTILFLAIQIFSFAQDQCYSEFLKAGIEAYDSLDFEKAINNFKAAKICEDKPKNDEEIEDWLESVLI